MALKRGVLRGALLSLAFAALLAGAAALCFHILSADIRTLQALRPAYHLDRTRTPRASEPSHHLEQWRRSFTEPRYLRTAPLGAILEHVHAALNAWQNPRHCPNASYFVYEYRSGFGFGAVIKHLTVGFYYALLTGRVFLVGHRHTFRWAHAGTTGAGARHECFFLPLSNTCSPGTVHHLARRRALRTIHITSKSPVGANGVPIIPKADPRAPSVVYFDMSAQSKDFLYSLGRDANVGAAVRLLLRRNLTAEQKALLTPQRNALRTVQTSLASYIIRLNARAAATTANAVERVLEHYGLSSDDHKRIVGVPIRKSDKCYGNKLGSIGEMHCVSTSTALEHARRIAYAYPSITHVLLTSEDESALSDAAINASQGKFINLTVMRNFLDIAPGSGGLGMRRDKTAAQLLETMLITLHLQALPSFHVITPRSTFHSLINVAANAMPGKDFNHFFPLGTFANLEASLVSQLVR